MYKVLVSRRPPRSGFTPRPAIRWDSIFTPFPIRPGVRHRPTGTTRRKSVQLWPPPDRSGPVTGISLMFRLLFRAMGLYRSRSPIHTRPEQRLPAGRAVMLQSSTFLGLLHQIPLLSGAIVTLITPNH